LAAAASGGISVPYRDDPIQNRLSEAQFKDLKIEKL
jgi:hypothetical protein